MHSSMPVRPRRLSNKTSGLVDAERRITAKCAKQAEGDPARQRVASPHRSEPGARLAHDPMPRLAAQAVASPWGEDVANATDEGRPHRKPARTEVGVCSFFLEFDVFFANDTSEESAPVGHHLEQWCDVHE